MNKLVMAHSLHSGRHRTKEDEKKANNINDPMILSLFCSGCDGHLEKKRFNSSLDIQRKRTSNCITIQSFFQQMCSFISVCPFHSYFLSPKSHHFRIRKKEKVKNRRCCTAIIQEFMLSFLCFSSIISVGKEKRFNQKQ